MALPVTIPNTFANATSSIPLSQLDTNFSTLANAVNGISSGSETLANVIATNLTVTNDATINGVRVGKGAGAVSTNTAVGASALGANTSGIQNTGLGANALQYQTNNNNTALGYNAMVGVNGSSNGGSNTAVGSNSLAGLTGGNFNTAIGQQSLLSNTTASNNTAVGYQASYNNTTGQITSLGYQAGFSNTTGIQSTFIGYQAGYNTTGSANTFVGGGTAAAAGYFVTTGTKNTILGGYHGNQDSYDMRTLSNRVVISDGDGNRQLTMYEGGTVALDNAVPAAGTGITFPATQSASSNANTLDDYEQGTFDATLTPGTSGTITVNSAYNRMAYTKIGRQVTITGLIIVSSVSSPVGTSVTLGNLPFPCSNIGEFASRSSAAIMFSDVSLATNTVIPSQIIEAESQLRFYMTAANIAANDEFVFGLTYFAAD